MVYTINNEQLTRRKLVTIDGSKVTTEISIPLGLNINLPGVKAAGADVRLAKLDGTPMAREIECKDVPNTDDVMLWYQWDTTASQNDQFYVYWGNSNLTEPAEDAAYGREAVWNSNHDAVYHMNGLTDSTSNDRDGTIQGTVTLGDGTYGKEYDFQGSSDWIHAPTGIASYPFTLTILMNLDTITDYDNYIFLNDWGNNVYMLGVMDYAQSPRKYTMLARDASTSDLAHGTTTAQTGVPQLIDVVFRSATDRELYLNGSSEIADATSVAFTASIDSLLIGQRRTADAGTLDGKVQEVRSRSDSKTTGEITTTYNNLKNPTSAGTTPFYLSFGTTQHQRRVPQFIN